MSQTTGVEQWSQFREQRNTTLAAENGWLTLTSLQWLLPDPSPVEGVPGLWSAGDPQTGAVLTARAGDGLTVAGTGAPVDGTLAIALRDGGSKNWVRYRDTVVELAVRGSRYVIRTRDNTAAAYTGFDGVPVHPYTGDAVVDAQFEPYTEPRAMPIRTAHPGVDDVMSATGTLTFALGGSTHTLVVEQLSSGSLKLAFHDETNGHTTAGWRFLVTDRPSPSGSVALDFNRALNYPSAFTPYGTCPQPVEGNRITVPVEAGELQPGLAA